MAHKTKVNGTNYKIVGGKTRIDGTNYKIVGGKTLVGGTAYKVGFDATITITGNGSSVATVTINGIKYNNATTITVPIGTFVTCEIKDQTNEGEGYIILPSGEKINNQVTTLTYKYTVQENTTFNLSYDRVQDYMSYSYIGYIEITEE